MPLPVLTNENQFDVDPGKYLAQFTDLVDKDPFENSAYGNSGRRYGWRFQIIGPPGTPMMGKIIEQNTGQVFSKRSGLVRLLNMMVKGGLQPKQAVDPNDFLGRLYQIKWAPNPDSDKGNCHIADLEEVGADAATTPPPRTITNPHAPPVPAGRPRAVHHNPSDAADEAAYGEWANQTTPTVDPRLPVPPAPPPRRGAQTAPRPSQGPQRYFVANGVQPPPLMTLAEVRTYIQREQVQPADLDLCPEGTDEWKPASAFGFEPPIPF